MPFAFFRVPLRLSPAFRARALCLWGTAVLGCGAPAADHGVPKGATFESAAANGAPADGAPADSAVPGGAAAGVTTGQLRQALSGAQLERNYSGTLALVAVTRERVELCTATLLTPNLVATARHCVAPTSADSVRCSQDPAAFSEPYDTDNLWVNRGRELRDSLVSYGLLPVTGGGGEFVPVAEVFVPDTERVCGGDLALLLLGEALDEGEAKPIAPRLDDPVEHGELYTAVGFGATPDPSQQGTRRSRAGLEVTCTPESCAGVAAVEDTEFRGGDGVCSGDSGGPAIDAGGRVTGIASRSADCTGSVYTALARFRGFIREVAEIAVREGDYPAPAWLEAAPPLPTPVDEAEAEDVDVDEPQAALPQVPRQTDSAPDVMADNAREPALASSAGGGSGCSLGGAQAFGAQHGWLLLLGLAVGVCARRRPLSPLPFRRATQGEQRP